MTTFVTPKQFKLHLIYSFLIDTWNNFDLHSYNKETGATGT